jgi:Protein of unknown function (DUF3782)
MQQNMETFEDIRAILRDIAEMQRQSDLKRQKNDEEIIVLRKEANERSKEADERSKALDKKIAEVSAQIGGIGNKFGHYTEALILPSMDRVLHERFGVDLEHISTRVRARSGERMIELDAFGYLNGEVNSAYVVEVKDIVKERHVEQMLRILADFPDFFPQHASKHLYGIIAGIGASDDVQRMMSSAGLYYADITDNVFSLASPPDFIGKDFRRVA